MMRYSAKALGISLAAAVLLLSVVACGEKLPPATAPSSPAQTAPAPQQPSTPTVPPTQPGPSPASPAQPAPTAPPSQPPSAPTPPPVTPPPTTPPPAPAPGGSKVTIKGTAFNPSALTVKVGDTVTWTNEDALSHSVAGAGFGSGALGQGKSYSFKFTAAGTFNYRCGYHPFMTGSIVVQ